MLSSAPTRVAISLSDESVLMVVHDAAVAGELLTLCVVPCTDESCVPGAPTSGSLRPFHPCTRRPNYIASFAIPLLLLLLLLLCVRSLAFQVSYAGRLEKYRAFDHSCTSIMDAVLMGPVALALCFCSLFRLGFPWYDDAWRYLAAFTLLVPPLALAGLATGFTSPMVAAALVLLLLAWRLAASLLALFVQDTAIFLVARVLLVAAASVIVVRLAARVPYREYWIDRRDALLSLPCWDPIIAALAITGPPLVPSDWRPSWASDGA